MPSAGRGRGFYTHTASAHIAHIAQQLVFIKPGTPPTSTTSTKSRSPPNGTGDRPISRANEEEGGSRHSHRAAIRVFSVNRRHLDGLQLRGDLAEGWPVGGVVRPAALHELSKPARGVIGELGAQATDRLSIGK